MRYTQFIGHKQAVGARTLSPPPGGWGLLTGSLSRDCDSHTLVGRGKSWPMRREDREVVTARRERVSEPGICVFSLCWSPWNCVLKAACFTVFFSLFLSYSQQLWKPLNTAEALRSKSILGYRLLTRIWATSCGHCPLSGILAASLSDSIFPV